MVQRIYHLGTSNAWLGKWEQFLPELVKHWRSSVHSFYSSISWQLCSLSLSIFKPGYRQMARGVRLSWSVPALFAWKSCRYPASIQLLPFFTVIFYGEVQHSELPKLVLVSLQQWPLLGKLTACSTALPYGHTAGMLQGHLWEKAYFWLAGVRSQQKHMSKRDSYFLSSWILFHGLWVSFFPPSPQIKVILVNIVCFAQGTQVYFDLPEQWQASELQHFIKLIHWN